MKKFLPVLRWVLALATMTVIAVLCWQAIDIYLVGSAPSNRTETGVLLQPIYRWDDVAARLSILPPLFLGYTALLAATLLLHAVYAPDYAVQLRRSYRLRAQKAARSAMSGGHASQAIRSRKGCRVLTIALYALAILLVGWGILNGGLRDVLIKAINICTECIGLG